MSGKDLPTYQDFMLPLLQQIAAGETRISATIPFLKSQFGLSDEQVERLLPSGKKTYIQDRAQWAQTYMTKAGLITRTGRALYAITERGRELLASNPAQIDNSTLATYEEYRKWKQGEEADLTTQSQPLIPAEVTPEEVLEQAYKQIDSALAEEMLAQVLTLTPARFEQLIVELLIAMGYGDGRAEMGRAIGKSGDGGIDGVVNEDKLGLDAVYIQAKRYKVDSSVDRPALQAFIGSMTGESATKGVFVTTSSFTKGAREYIRRVQQRVVLIDGTRLARLMIDHGVGVVVEKTYILRAIDANFFEPV